MKYLRSSSFFSKNLASITSGSSKSILAQFQLPAPVNKLAIVSLALGFISTTAIANAHCPHGTETTEKKSTHTTTIQEEPTTTTTETRPINSSLSGTRLGDFAFTFDNAFDYSSCIDIILLAHEQRIGDLEQARQNQCANEVLATFGTNISRELALELVEASNIHATEKLERSLYPVLGIRRRAAINLGYVYDIDRNNPEVLKLLNPRR